MWYLKKYSIIYNNYDYILYYIKKMISNMLWLMWINVYYFITLKWISVGGIKVNLLLSLYNYVGIFSRKDSCIARVGGLVEGKGWRWRENLFIWEDELVINCCCWITLFCNMNLMSRWFRGLISCRFNLWF